MNRADDLGDRGDRGTRDVLILVVPTKEEPLIDGSFCGSSLVRGAIFPVKLYISVPGSVVGGVWSEVVRFICKIRVDRMDAGD